MRSTVAESATDPREQVAPRTHPDPSAIALRLPARFTRTPSRTTPCRPDTPARRAGAERMQIRVLVADDHPLVREGVIGALEHDPGIEVIGETDNGVTAMELALELKPDMMLLGLRMRGLAGPGVLQRLRTELPDVRALVTADESRSPRGCRSRVANPKGA